MNNKPKLNKRLIKKAVIAHRRYNNGPGGYEELIAYESALADVVSSIKNERSYRRAYDTLIALLDASCSSRRYRKASLDFVCKALELLGYEIVEKENE